MSLRLSTCLVGLALLTACNSDYLDLEAGLSINNEQVFSTVSSIEEVQAAAHGTNPTYAQTQYPIVLVHGLYGFDDILGIDYWYRVAEAIELGGGTVYTIPVPKLNSTVVRGEHLLAELQKLEAATGAGKFHLMGHSHGGPTVRYIINTAPELLASVTTIGGVNAYGIEGIDQYVDALESFFPGVVGQGMLNGLAELIEHLGGNQQNHQSYALGSFRSFSREAVLAFNHDHPHGLPPGWDDGSYINNCLDGGGNPIEGAYSANVAGHDILFYSWSGTGVKTNVLDPLDLLISYSADNLSAGANDGMVEQCISHFGKVIRSDYDLNHLDEMNWAFALRRATATNPLIIYRQTANTLKNEGL
ncbi:MAG TPA: alpha/beta fold hydrolase [Pseudomonadales bacterium]